MHQVDDALLELFEVRAEKVRLAGADPVPLDLRDAVSMYSAPSTIDPYIASFAPRITERLQHADQREFVELQSPVTSLFLGASAAENEWADLGEYYIQTDEYRRLVRGEIQVIAGRKGSGKSALFFQVRDRLAANRQNVVAARALHRHEYAAAGRAAANHRPHPEPARA